MVCIKEVNKKYRYEIKFEKKQMVVYSNNLEDVIKTMYVK